MTADDLVKAQGNRRKAKPKPPPEPRADLLRRLLADIEEHDHHAHRPALWERLFAETGTRLKTGEDDQTTLTLAGIVTQSGAGRSGALMVWARRARRELAEIDGIVVAPSP